MSVSSLCDLSVVELGDLLDSLSLNKLKTILQENEFSGAMLDQVTSVEELLSVDSRIKPSEAKGWYTEICKWKDSLPEFKPSAVSLECPVCTRKFLEVDPTTLLCGHSLCVEDAKSLANCPICHIAIASDFKCSVNFALKELATQSESVQDVAIDQGSDADDDSVDAEEANTSIATKKGKKKKKRKNNKKKKPSAVVPTTSTVTTPGVTTDQIVTMFEQARYFGNNEAFLQLEIQAKTNHYAMGFLELYYSTRLCCNVSFEWSEVQKSFDVLQSLADTNDKYALFIVALRTKGFMKPECELTQLELRPMTPPSIFVWLKRSFDMDFKLALCEVAECYSDGFGVSQNHAKAIELHNQAINLGCVFSYFWLAQCTVATGRIPDSFKYFNDACSHNIAEAEFFWGRLQWDLAANSLNGKLLMHRAAEHGDITAMEFLAMKEPTGPRMYEWYRKAARKGRYRLLEAVLDHCDFLNETEYPADEVDFYRLGARIRVPKGTALWARVLQLSGKHSEALDLLKRVPLTKDKEGYLHCAWGECYEYGRGVDIDYGEALRYYHLAVRQGSHIANTDV